MGRFNIGKGDRFKIAKSEGLSKIKVKLDWSGKADLDASTFMCGDEGVILDDAGFVFYNSENREKPFDRSVFGNKNRWRAETRPMSSDGAVLGAIDDRSGDSGEIIDVDLDSVSPDISEIVFVATIHDDDTTFGDVEQAYIAVINAENNEELCRYELNEEFTSEDGVSVAKLVINEDGDWEFEPMGLGHEGGIQTLIDIYAG